MIRQLGAPRRVARWARGEGSRARGVGGHCRGPGRLADQSQREDFFMPIYGHGVGRDAGRGARGAARPSILNRGAFPPPKLFVFEVASSPISMVDVFSLVLRGENGVFGVNSGGERGRSRARATPAGTPRPHSRAVARQGRSFRGESRISSFISLFYTKSPFFRSSRIRRPFKIHLIKKNKPNSYSRKRRSVYFVLYSFIFDQVVARVRRLIMDVIRRLIAGGRRLREEDYGPSGGQPPSATIPERSALSRPCER